MARLRTPIGPCVAHPGHSVAAAAVPSGQVPVGGALIAAARNVIAQRRAASPATWLKTHAAFAVPLGQAVNAAGGPVAHRR
ncbi:MAG: hypothetical protein QOH97_1854 [Actinoplanes sp.]|jgi:hypothetical protein|nr:hypothetical protein [Actinoplanes sp.]